jgi:uncharacterized SAM-binding protein YcdF (DUF218 family)
MLYLAKILPAFVLPTGVVLLLLGAGIVFRKRALTIAALAILWLSSTSVVADVVMRAAEGWQTRQPVSAAPNADAIVVLSGMLREVPGAEHEEEWLDSVDRFDAGVALAKAGKAPLLVFTAQLMPWDTDTDPKGRVLADRAAALGVPADRILVTGRVRNTADEATAVASLLRSRTRDRQPGSVILVTSAYHMRRSRLLFTRAGLTVAPFPVDFQTSAGPITAMDLLPHAGSIQNVETAMRELYGYLFYRLIKTT